MIGEVTLLPFPDVPMGRISWRGICYSPLMLTLCLAVAFGAELDLESALREGMEESPYAEILRAEREAALGEAQHSAALENPSLEFEKTGEEVEWRASLPIPIAGQPILRWRRAALQRRGADARFDERTADLAAEIASAYLDVVRAEQWAKLSSDLSVDSERVREAVVRLGEAGEISPIDRAMGETLALEAVSQAALAQQEETTAKLKLEALLGRSPTGEIDVVGWPDLPRPALVGLEDRPSVQVALEASRSAEAARTLAILDRVPSPELTLGQRMHGESEPIVGIKLEIPLLAPGVGAVRTARAEMHHWRSELQIRRFEAEAQWSTADSEERLAEAAWRRISEVQGLQTAVEETSRAFLLGEFSASELATRREHLVRALEIQLNARYRLERARLELWRLQGQIPGGAL